MGLAYRVIILHVLRSCASSLCTVEPHLTVTSLVKPPHHYGHLCSVPNCIPPCKLAPCSMVTSPLRSLLSSPVGDRNSEVPLYSFLLRVSSYNIARPQFWSSHLPQSTHFHLLITTTTTCSMFLATFPSHMSLASLVFYLCLPHLLLLLFSLSDLLNPLYSHHPSQHSHIRTMFIYVCFMLDPN